MPEETTTLRRMCWLFPDRESTRTGAKWAAAFWDTYVEVAKELDLSWDRVAPEAVTVDALDPHAPKVHIDGEPVTPADTLFVTSLYSLPYQAADVFNQFTLYAVLEQVGFYLPHPPALAAVCNDKLATILFLRDCPIPPIPTVRIGSGRDLVYDEYEAAIRDLPYPALAKPAGWCASRGINLARDPHDVRGLLSLAQGGDTTLVFQPYLGAGTADYRVHLVDGEPVTVLVRTPGDGALYPQFTTGGRLRYAPLPDELTEAVAWMAEKLPVPFLCVDFLHDGERFWLSEIELDGSIMCPDPGSPEAVRTQRDLIRARFEAYRRGHARRLAGAAPGAA
ncbi:ATP-grasp domain-containing protein [Micromonospora zhanjiangensis]|uniref:RimK family alpha-L-glutamate ligase n=1 Tax=Micromonospora zhanjiangensis TaxID=1522057 RepID=A0ABV8KTU9_9ACTN